MLGVSQGSGRGRIGDVVAKRVRGHATRYLLESDAEPEDPDELAAVFGERWPVAVRAPGRPGKPWTMTLSTDD